MRVVVSLTTMPDKWDKVIRTLRSLNNQTYKPDAIYLSLPWKCKRLNIPYPEPTEEMLSLCTVVRVKDYGPITKISGFLFSEQDPDTVGITVDDDMIYPPTMIEELVKRHVENPNCALGSAGMLLRKECPMCSISPNELVWPFHISKIQLGKKGRKVDSIYGYPGALYVRKFFPASEDLEEQFFSYALVDRDMFINDDITISGYLSSQGVERRIFPDIPEVSFVLDEGVRVRKESEISFDLDIFFQRMNRSIAKAKQLGMYKDTQPIYYNETIFYIVLITVLAFILLILFLIIMFCRSSDSKSKFDFMLWS